MIDVDQGGELRGTVFTLAEAGRAVGKSRDTIKRRLTAGRFPNAAKDTAGVWRIPLVDLLGDGLTPHAAEATVDVEATAARQRHTFDRTAELAAEVDVLRARLDERERALQAVERARTEAERARHELAEALTAALARIPALPAGEYPAGPSAPSRRRWWRR